MRVPFLTNALSIFIFLLRPAFGYPSEASPERPLISQQEFDSALTEKRTIENRTIPATFISAALAAKREPQSNPLIRRLSAFACSIAGRLIVVGKHDQPRFLGLPEVEEVTVPFSFVDCTFTGEVIFLHTRTAVKVWFLNCQMTKPVEFRVHFENSPDFSGTTFQDTATFSDSRADRDVYFDGAIFEGRADFNNVSVPRADFSNVRFSERASFVRSSFSEQALFITTEFRGFTTFRGTSFGASAVFRHATFEQDVDFGGCRFPGPRLAAKEGDASLDIRDVRFLKSVAVDWSQLLEPRGFWAKQIKVTASDAAAWSALEQAFKSSGNLEAQNEALYQRRLLDGGGFWNLADRIFWGFGVRPFRVIGWMIAVFLLFGAVYWIEITRLTKSSSDFWGLMKQAREALAFSARTSWKWSYGWSHARTPTFKAIVATQRLLFIAMLFCLLHVLSNVSPILNGVLSKLLPL